VRKLHVAKDLKVDPLHNGDFRWSFTVDLSNQLNKQARTTPADERARGSTALVGARFAP
jgi:hypothetical protein